MFLSLFSHLVLLEPAQGSPPKYPNIGYVGSCYDIFRGNPLNTGGLDPGFMGHGIFQFTYSQNRTTADGRYSIPDHTMVNDAQSCSFSFSSSVTRDAGSYMDSLKVHVDAEFRGWGASFSTSDDYQQVHKSTENRQTMYISSQAQCEAYGASVDGATFLISFVDSVLHLPDVVNSSTQAAYLNFIQEYGTHIASAIKMGGRYGIRSEFTTQNYSALSSTDLNIKASAGYSGLVHVGASLDTEQKKKDAETYNDHRTTYLMYQVGGKPPVDENQTAFEWAQTVKEDPLPLSYSLTELYKYLTRRFIPQEPNIDIKRENLRNVTYEYCILHVPDTSLCMKDFGPGKKDSIYVVSSDVILHDYLGVPGGERYGYVYTTNPTYRNLGAMFGYFKESISVIMVNALRAPSKLITGSIGVVGYKNKTMRYQCPSGYSTVTDDISFPIMIATTHVCVANDCLTNCTRVETIDPEIYLIGSGFPQFGNSGSMAQGSFFRNVNINDSTPIDDLFKCLNYDCLSF